MSIAAVIDGVPGGCIVFLPSYDYLEKLVSGWKGTDIWQQIVAQKHV